MDHPGRQPRPGALPIRLPGLRRPASLRLEGPALGLGLDPEEIDAYLAAVSAGLIVAETRCDKGMQDNFALRAETTVELTAP